MKQTAKRSATGVLRTLLCAAPAALVILPAFAAAGGPPEGAGGPPGGAGGPPGGGVQESGADLASILQPLAWTAVAVVGVLAAAALAAVVITFVKKSGLTRLKAGTKEILYRVGVGVSALVFTFSLTATTLANASAPQANSYLRTTNTKVVSNGDGDNAYFTSAFGSWQEQYESARKLGVTLQEEGSVLLENNGALPLASGAKVSLFSRSSVDILYGGTGSGAIDTSVAPNLRSALEEAGFQVNGTLWDFYIGQEGYARRFMKGNMSREEFNAWAEHAAAQRDFTIELLKVAKSEEERARQIEAFREDLNRL